jgi:hypothetical protein
MWNPTFLKNGFKIIILICNDKIFSKFNHFHTHSCENDEIASMHPYSLKAFLGYQDCTPNFFKIFFWIFVDENTQNSITFAS